MILHILFAESELPKGRSQSLLALCSEILASRRHAKNVAA